MKKNCRKKDKKIKNPIIRVLRDKDISIADSNFYTKYLLDPYSVPKMDLGGFTGDINNKDEYIEYMRQQGILPNFAPDPNQIGQNIPQQFQTQPIQSDMSNAIPGFNDRINNNTSVQSAQSGQPTKGQKVQKIFDNLPSFQASTKPIIDVMSTFANIHYSNQMKQDEMRRMRQTLAPVISANNFTGDDMPLYQKNGGIVVKDLGYNGTEGLTDIQLAVLEGRRKPTSVEDVTPAKPADYRKLPNAPQWVRDAPLSPYTTNYITSGHWNTDGSYKDPMPYVGPNYSGSAWASNVPLPTDIRTIDNRGLPYAPTSNGRFNINTNFIYKEGGQVNSIPLQSTKKLTKSNKGYNSKDFEVSPNLANVLAEDGEFIRFPDGSTTPITGDKHSDPSGGEYLNLPESSEIFSDKLKADKEFSSDILGRKVKKKLSISDLAKKFDTTKAEEVLNSKKATDIQKRTASINKELRNAKLEEIFQYQEMIKNPDKVVLDEIIANAPVIAEEGIKVPRRGGWLGEGNINGYSPDQVEEYNDVLYNLALQTGYTGPKETGPLQTYVFNQYPNLSQDYFTNRVPPTNKATTKYGVTNQGVPNPTEMGELSQEQVIDSAVDNIAGIRTFLPQYPVFGDVNSYMTAKSGDPITEGPLQFYPYGSVADEDNMPFIYQNPRLSLNPITGGSLPSANPNITAQSVRVNPLNFRSNQEEDDPKSLSKKNKNKKSKNRKGMDVDLNFGDYAPEIFQAIQALNEFPVFTAKYQPTYLRPTEVNVQDNLNRNQSAAAPLLQSSGNPAIANARAQQAAANLFEANNAVYQQKYNIDNQNRQQVAQYNNQLENQANLTNLQRVDDFWHKVTARQANKEKDLNTIVDSAYAKAKNKQMEKRSLNLINQMFKNYKYDGNNIQFVKDNQGNLFQVNSNGMLQPANMGIIEGDGKKTTVTETVDSKGKKKKTIRTTEDPRR